MRFLDSRPCAAVASALGSPQRRLQVVHVAGSKGKGSVSALVAAGLEASGRRVGLITSPHASRVTERVRVGSGRGLVEVGDDELAVCLERAADAVEAARREPYAASPLANATWFDVFTAAALKCVSSLKCDAVVVECGLGGARDSTNFLDAPLAAVTSVELEHADVLGATTTAIATEKAGICARGGTLVLGAMARGPREAARRVARRRGATVVDAGVRRGSRGGDPKTGRPKLSLAPLYAARFHPASVAVAKTILDELAQRARHARGRRARRGRLESLGGALLDDARAFRRAAKALPARAEAVGANVVVDAAHTSAAIRSLARMIKLRGRRLVVVFALAKDKDVESVAAALTSELKPHHVICCAPDHEFVEPETLARAVAERAGDATTVESREAESALRRATDIADPPNPAAESRRPLVLILGSFKLRALVADAAAAADPPA